MDRALLEAVELALFEALLPPEATPSGLQAGTPSWRVDRFRTTDGQDGYAQADEIWLRLETGRDLGNPVIAGLPRTTPVYNDVPAWLDPGPAWRHYAKGWALPFRLHPVFWLKRQSIAPGTPPPWGPPQGPSLGREARWAMIDTTRPGAPPPIDGLLVLEPCPGSPVQEGQEPRDTYILNVKLGFGAEMRAADIRRGYGQPLAHPIYYEAVLGERGLLAYRRQEGGLESSEFMRDFVLRFHEARWSAGEVSFDVQPFPEIGAWIYREVGISKREEEYDDDDDEWILVDVGVWKNLRTGEIQTSLLEFN
jgi:hypothetical protein